MNSKVTRLFKNGSNQAVRIPKEMAFNSEEVRLPREDNKLIIEPVQPKTGLNQLLASWEPLNIDFPEIEDTAKENKGIFD